MNTKRYQVWSALVAGVMMGTATTGCALAYMATARADPPQIVTVQCKDASVGGFLASYASTPFPDLSADEIGLRVTAVGSYKTARKVGSASFTSAQANIEVGEHVAGVACTGGPAEFAAVTFTLR